MIADTSSGAEIEVHLPAANLSGKDSRQAGRRRPYRMVLPHIHFDIVDFERSDEEAALTLLILSTADFSRIGSFNAR